MSRPDSLQEITAEENISKCPECGGEMDNDGDERYCKKCGYVVE